MLFDFDCVDLIGDLKNVNVILNNYLQLQADLL